ncbi:MAG TPA: nuclear transport factor 2 family protein [Candidatus Binatia bacterium]|nr:nuclear transport factor 2 family protein [Candidatus Binatia bacterium]
MTDVTALERRIRALEDLEAIKRLKYRYFRCLDLKLWDEMAGCFTPDATVDYGGGRYRFDGVDAIIRFLRESLARETGALGYHHGHHPEIDLTSDTTARGIWALDNYLFNASRKRGVRIAAYYRDEYVKRDGEWRIRHTGYTYVFHEEWSRDDTPSIRLLAP